MIKTWLIFGVACLWLTGGYSQTEEDLNLARESMPERVQNPYPYRYLGENEVKETARLLFSGYKYLISSQDRPSCNFQPSCSEYGLLATQQWGVVKGFLATFDRLTRCHPLNLAQYPRDPETGLALDPVGP